MIQGENAVGLKQSRKLGRKEKSDQKSEDLYMHQVFRVRFTYIYSQGQNIEARASLSEQ